MTKNRKLTVAAVVAAVLAAVALFVTLQDAGRKDASLVGRYRLVITGFPGGGLPVGLDVVAEPTGIAAYLVNGDNRVRAEETIVKGGRLDIVFPSYDSSLVLQRQADGSLDGTARLMRRTGRLDLPLRAEPGQSWRFQAAPAAPAFDLSGEWALETKGEGGERGVLIIRQDGNVLQGTAQFPSGDVRYLAGQIWGGEFALSTFDGNQGSLWKGRIATDGSLAGESFGATSTGGTAFAATRGTAASVEAIGTVSPPVDRIAFTFPDTKGQPVSLSDERFKGKVVVVAIGGTWCPNCHDEAIFLAPYAKRRRAEGLEVIGLQFEYGDDPVRAARQSERFARRYGIDYPLLVAGSATPEDSRRALPAIGGVKIYPTTLFIDRKGKLRAIHTGYSGPATGDLHRKAVAEFDALVSRLLAEGR